MDLLHEVIVVDGHSTDGTPELVRSLGHKVVVQNGNGYGRAVQSGLEQATGEYLTFFDADGSYNPEALTRLSAELEKGFDVVYCSRYLPNSGSDDDTPIRLLGNKIFTGAMRYLHGVQLSDALFLYPLIRREVLKKIVMNSTGFDWCIEFPIRVHQAGLKYTEIPSRERKRLAGVSKVNALWDGLDILRTLCALKFTKPNPTKALT